MTDSRAASPDDGDTLPHLATLAGYGGTTDSVDCACGEVHTSHEVDFTHFDDIHPLAPLLAALATIAVAVGVGVAGCYAITSVGG